MKYSLSLDASFQGNYTIRETFQVDSLPAERQIVEQAAGMQSEQEWKSLCDHALRVGGQTPRGCAR